MKFTNLIHILFSLGFLGLLFSCNDNPGGPEDTGIITNSINATLDEVKTRANFSWDDEWTRSNFSKDDKAGLFSSRGNNLEGSGAGGFYNVMMTYGSGNGASSVNQFTNDNIQINTYQLNQGNLIMYLPYSEFIQNPGLELRTMVDGSYRCKDFLLAYEKNYDRGVLNARFIHQFCVVIVVRGEGFDDPKILPEETGDPYEINFVLNQGFSHIKYASTPSYWQPYPELVYQEGYIPDKATKEMTKEECRKWPTWKGGKYNGKDAWYVVLPTHINVGGAKAATKIDYIEIRDNFGLLQKISSFSLGEATDRTIYSSNVCPLLVKMEELGPTIYTYPIENWNEDQDITIRRSSGINSATEFNEWVGIYYNYIQGNRDLSYDDRLKKYGDKINGVWHFNLLASLDNEDLEQINILEDIIDGRSNILENGFYENNVISNMNRTKPLIDRINGGEIRNLDFENITLEPSGPDAIGVVAKEIINASFNNCKIDGSISSNGAVGLISGTVKDCNIEKSNFTGFLIGSSSFSEISSFAYLFGNRPTGEISINNSDNRSIIFTTK